MWWRQQDSFISGARLHAIGSGACSVTVGHRAHAVRGAGRTFEFGCQNGNKKTIRHWCGLVNCGGGNRTRTCDLTDVNRVL